MVSEARRIAEDPAVDGFGHHNPHVGIEDDLFMNALSVDCMIEGLFQGRDLSANESQFVRLARMGILDGQEGYDLPITAATRSMRFTVAIVMRVWAMYEGDHQRVGLQLG